MIRQGRSRTLWATIVRKMRQPSKGLELARTTSNARVVGNRHFDDPHLASDGLAGKLGLDFEARGAKLNRVAETAVKDPIPREQVAGSGADQEPERVSDQEVPQAPHWRHRTRLGDRPAGPDCDVG